MSASMDAPQQVLVFARGFNDEGGPSQATTERALAAAEYYDEHGAQRIIFSGGRSFLSEEGIAAVGSRESDFMEEIARANGVPASVIVKPASSTNTVTNALTSVPFINQKESLGVVSHKDQMARCRWAAGLVVASPLVSIEAVSQNAPSLKDRQIMMAKELVAFGINWASFIGVRRLDLVQVEQRNAAVERNMLRLMTMARPIVSRVSKSGEYK